MTLTVLGPYKTGCIEECCGDGIAGEAQDVEDRVGGRCADCGFSAEVHPWLGVEGDGPCKEAGGNTMLGHGREVPGEGEMWEGSELGEGGWGRSTISSLGV